MTRIEPCYKSVRTVVEVGGACSSGMLCGGGRADNGYKTRNGKQERNGKRNGSKGFLVHVRNSMGKGSPPMYVHVPVLIV